MSRFCAVVHADGAPVRADLLTGMIRAAERRGPHGTGIACPGPAGLAQASLHATAEARRERAPLHTTDSDLWLVADARLDNRDELLDRFGGLIPAVATDGELILAAYERWGADCPAHLVGDFAFAVWDAPHRRLFCARDALGVKPLHYALATWAPVGPLACVASEAQQILGHPAFSADLDETYLGRYLVGDLDAGRSPFADVACLPPAHRLTVERGRATVDRYWDLAGSDSLRYRRRSEYVDHFRELFDRSVAERLRTDGPTVGILLSGGLDSTSVAASARKVLIRERRRQSLLALSVVFDELPECDERSFIRPVAERLDLDSHCFDAGQHQLLGPRAGVYQDLESPFLGWVATERRMLARLAERNGRVLLTGHGGDALLYGSPRVYADQLRQGRLARLARDLREHAADRPVSAGHLFYHYALKPYLPGAVDRLLRRLAGRSRTDRVPEWIVPGFARRSGLGEYLGRRREARTASDEVRQSASSLDGLGQAIAWCDRLASAYGVEVRHPFLDRRIAEFVAAVPPEELYRAGRGKLLLRRAMAGRLPEKVRRRSDKTSFRPFLDRSLRTQAIERVSKLLDRPRLGELGVVEPGLLRRALGAYRRGERTSLDRLLWQVATLELWIRGQWEPAREGGGPARSEEAPERGINAGFSIRGEG